MARLEVFGEPGDPRKWVACANQISARIADGRYSPSEWLPSFAKISADLGTAHGNATMRRALEELRAQKLISSVPRVGYYTGDGEPPHKPPRELRDYATRRKLAATPRAPQDGPLPTSCASQDGPLLTPREVAAMFRVDPKTVTRWAKAGKLTCIRTLGGIRRYYASEAETLLRESRQEKRQD